MKKTNTSNYLIPIAILGSMFFLLSAQLSTAQPGIDYAKTKTLHVVGTSHLDTQWRWTIQTSISDYIPKTLRLNFDLFEKFPEYNFSYEGAFKYQLAKEYYPVEYVRLKKYIAANRWHICGSSYDAGDVNVPSPEAIFRNILIGQTFYRKEFNKDSRDLYMPDCFGFGYALPSIAAHCGLKGFSTQKLDPREIPFEIGAWQGVYGS
jgi:alpha-mannosidase